MIGQLRSYLMGILLSACLLLAACATEQASSALPTARAPLPSPRPAFTGLPLPATLPAPSQAATPTPTKQNVAASTKTTALTILYTNDTRGYVDPCG